jgi:hypothetical protein
MKNLYKIEDELYIISNTENVDENCWIITDGKLVQVSYLLSDEVAKGNKVILTTNKLLIKDGVQAIDDEFLEWFVKNPNCEWVELEKFEDGDCVIAGKEYINYSYEIIIPKEEPKQLFTKGDRVLFTGKMLNEEVVDKVVTVFYILGRGDITDMSEIVDEYAHIYKVWNKDLKHIPKEEPKQKVICTNDICQGECVECNFMTIVNVEEPKQEITGVDDNRPKPNYCYAKEQGHGKVGCVFPACHCGLPIKQEEAKQEYQSECICENSCRGFVNVKCKQLKKQETLEEAAEEFYPPITTDLICSPKLVRDAFIAGANYQAERMYSDMQEYAEFCIECDRKEMPLLLVQDWYEHYKK